MPKDIRPSTPPPTLSVPESPPSVIKWFRVYLVVLCLVYAFCIVYGWAEASSPSFSSQLTRDNHLPAETEGQILLIAGIIFFLASALPFFLKPRPWVWIYDLVVICLGMMSCCFLPFCIPLLIFWFKSETKGYFGRGDV
jgi:Na+(H+)/acetate symporter ActP